MSSTILFGRSRSPNELFTAQTEKEVRRFDRGIPNATRTGQIYHEFYERMNHICNLTAVVQIELELGVAVVIIDAKMW